MVSAAKNQDKQSPAQLHLIKERLGSGWVSLTIGDLCHEERVVVNPDAPLAKELPYLGLEHVESGSGRILNERIAARSSEGRSVTFRFDERHVLYGKLRPYLNKVALPDFEGRCTTELIPLLPRTGVSREFLAWLLRRPQTVEAAMREKTGARMPRADMRRLLSLSVTIPADIEEQRRLAAEMTARMSLVDEAKAACQEQLTLLATYAEKILASFSVCPSSDAKHEEQQQA